MYKLTCCEYLSSLSNEQVLHLGLHCETDIGIRWILMRGSSGLNP